MTDQRAAVILVGAWAFVVGFAASRVIAAFGDGPAADIAGWLSILIAAAVTGWLFQKE